MIAYLDSSLLVSLYVIDANSAAAEAAVRRCTDVPVISTLCQIEVLNAFGLQVFRKQISQLRADFSVRNLDEDLRVGNYQLRPLPESTFARAREISLKFTPATGVRAADLLHVAAALELGADTLFSFDLAQLKLARMTGLAINPVATP